MKIHFVEIIFGLLITFIYAWINTQYKITLETRESPQYDMDGRLIIPDIFWNNFIFRDFLTHFDYVLISFYIIQSAKYGYFFVFVVLLLIKSLISFHYLEDNLYRPGRNSGKKIIPLFTLTILFSINYVFIKEIWEFFKFWIFSRIFH